MMMKNTGGNIFLLFLLMALGCVETFDSPISGLPNNYLVVEGVISDGKNTFRLSRTSNLNQDTAAFETGAQVHIENESGTFSRALDETGNGIYEAVLDLDANEQYRVKIYTANDAEYVSDFVPLVASPEIDSVTWSAVDGETVQLYVTTHDPDNNTRYYRWTYEETWQYRANFYSNLDYVNGEVVYRDYVNDDIYNCWQSDASTQILVNSTVRLQEDVVFKQPLVAINSGSSSKLDVKYSILVKQYALTQEAFEYWELLKKNSEDLGTLFDPQPSQLRGNITCTTNPDEPVLGFISAGSISEQRIFIRRSDIAELIDIPYNRNPSCELDTIPLSDAAIKDAFAQGDTIPVNEVYGFGGLEGYEASANYCVDCRTRGGTTDEPDFWQ